MPSPIKVLAEEKGLPVFQPVSLRPQENQQLVADLQADVMVVVAYGLILPKAASWLYQRSWFTAATLAWCCTNPTLTMGG